MYGLFKSSSLGRSTSLQDSNRTHSSYKRRKSITFSPFPESIPDVSIASSGDIPSAVPLSHTLNPSKRLRHHMRFSSLLDATIMLSPDNDRTLSFGSSSSIASTRSSSGSPVHREISSMDDYFSFPSLDPVLPQQEPPKPKSFLDFWMIKGSHTVTGPRNTEVEMEPYEEIVVNGVRL